MRFEHRNRLLSPSYKNIIIYDLKSLRECETIKNLYIVFHAD